MKVIFGGNLVDLKDFTLNPDNRAFHFGDGLFETIIYKNREIRFLEDPFQRIVEGRQALSLFKSEYFTLEYMDRQIRLLINENQLSRSVRM